jgi:hypothetical protein
LSESGVVGNAAHFGDISYENIISHCINIRVTRVRRNRQTEILSNSPAARLLSVRRASGPHPREAKDATWKI